MRSSLHRSGSLTNDSANSESISDPENTQIKDLQLPGANPSNVSRHAVAFSAVLNVKSSRQTEDIRPNSSATRMRMSRKLRDISIEGTGRINTLRYKYSQKNLAPLRTCKLKITKLSLLISFKLIEADMI